MWRLLRYDWPLHLVLLLTSWMPDNVRILRLRGWLAHFFFRQCGRDLRLGRRLCFYNPSNIIIGSNVYIAYGNWFSAGDLIVIENEVLIGPYSVFSSSNHTSINHSFRYGPKHKAPIRIASGVWISANCTITAGSNIGRGCLIGAGTVVTKSVREGVLFAGNPGRELRRLHGTD